MTESKRQKQEDYVKQVNKLHNLEQKLKTSYTASKKSLKVDISTSLLSLIQLLRSNKRHSEADNLESQFKEVKKNREILQEIKIR